MIPSRAIIIYEDKKSYGKEYFLESREIKNVKGKYAFMAPVPLASNILRDIANSFHKNDATDMNVGGIIAPHLLYGIFKPGKVVVMWYRPAGVRQLNFVSGLGINGDTNVSCPATLYIVINEKLYVYALMTSERPTEMTKIYNAPFFNIYQDGNVCLGSAKVGNRKAETFELEAARFERAFYMAEQSGGISEKNCKTPLKALWNRIKKSKAPFPSKLELKQHPKFKTLSDLLTKLIGDHSIK
jgi:PRTRC genetic system protein B